MILTFSLTKWFTTDVNGQSEIKQTSPEPTLATFRGSWPEAGS